MRTPMPTPPPRERPTRQSLQKAEVRSLYTPTWNWTGLTLICRGGSTLGRGSAWQGHGNLLEQGLDVVSGLGAGLNAHDAELLCALVEVLGCDLALVVQVRLVAHQHDDDVLAALVAHVVDPLGRVEEGGAVWERRQYRVQARVLVEEVQ